MSNDHRMTKHQDGRPDVYSIALSLVVAHRSFVIPGHSSFLRVSAARLNVSRPTLLRRQVASDSVARNPTGLPARSLDQDIVTGPTVEDVLPRPTVQDVVPGAPVEGVIAGSSN